jgi:ribokinase
MSKIVVVGSSNVDMVVKAPHIPRPGETVMGGDFLSVAGGKGANQAVGAARAGGDVTFVARVGNDVFGEQTIEGLKKDNIDVSHITRDADAPSGVALIFVGADGANSIAVAPGANARLTPKDIEAAASSITTADVLILQLETPMETVLAAAQLAHENGVKVILNPAPACPLSDELLAYVTLLTPNESEAGTLTDIPTGDEKGDAAAAAALYDKGIETVLLTLGARGVYTHTADWKGHVAGFKVKAVDSTAAGDVFNGALAVAIAEGKDLNEAINFANAAGALAVTRLGAQPSAPTREEIESLLERQVRSQSA